MIKNINCGTTVDLHFNQQGMRDARIVFRKLYLCFDISKRSWKMRCRPIIDLVECQLKGVVNIQVSIVVGKNAVMSPLHR